ncbi:MAG: DNA internalization-related competence protein ComEC/Rec2 [Burkholderiaceae bacterium]
MHPATWHRPGAAAGLLPALLGWLGGCALQLAQPVLWPWWAYAALVLGGVAGWLALARTGWGVRAALGHACLACIVAALAFGQVGLRAVGFQANRLSPDLEGRDLLLTGVVATMPQRGANGLRFQMRVESAQADGVAVPVPPRIQLGWYAGFGVDAARGAGGMPALWAGERWRMVVRLKAPHGNSNPLGFDYELWLWEHGIQATGYVRDNAAARAPQRLAQTGRHPVEWLRQRVRQRIDDRLSEAPQAGWITALVTGDQNAIDRADWDVFRATGVSHLMSISGLHVTMFAWLAATLSAAVWRASARLCLWFPASHAGWIGGPALALAYAVFSGWGVPAQRTVVMLAVVCLLRLSSRSWPWPMVWLLAGAAVLLIDPWALLQPGFWLSFVAVGVLFASGDRAHGQPASPWHRLHALLREQWIITLALTPLVLLLFGQVSLVGFVANLFAIPWVTLLLTPLAMLGTVFAPTWDLAALAVAVLARVLAWLAGFPFATVSVASAPFAVAVVAVLGGVLVSMRLPAALRLAGAALVLPVLLWQAPRPEPGRFDLLAVDIGQGNAVLVRTARHALLYDAGPRYSRDSDAGHRVLVPLLRALGVAPDLLVLSHSDSDHVGGAASVLDMYPAMALTGSIAPDHALWASRAGRRCAAGQRWHWDGVEFVVLHPREADYTVRGKPNAVSCVLRIRSAATRHTPVATALLAGDIESAQEQQLVTDRADLRADLLLVPHHGSKTSSSGVFLDAVQPRVALVQSGYRNRFGHPAPEPMARYQERGIAVFNSPHCGAMAWRSERPSVVSCHRLAQPRYWQHRADGQTRF